MEGLGKRDEFVDDRINIRVVFRILDGVFVPKLRTDDVLLAMRIRFVV